MLNFTQKIFTKTSFYYLSKGLDKLLKLDNEVKSRLEIIPNDTKIKISILDSNQSLVLKKCNNGFYTCKDKSNCDLTITFKFFKALPQLVFGACSVTDCYLMDEFVVCGELRYAVAMVYAIECFLAYILPKKLYEKIYKKKSEKKISTAKMYMYLIFSKRGYIK